MVKSSLVAAAAFSALVSCAPPEIVVPDSRVVDRTERSTREVELCVLVQESEERPRWQGVADTAAGKWSYAIASIAVKQPPGC